MARSRDISKVLSSNTTLATDAEVAASYLTTASASTVYQTKATAGLTLLTPASIANTGGTASIGANGTVSFTSASAISLNDVFSATYTNYQIVIECDGSTSAQIRMRLREPTDVVIGVQEANYIIERSEVPLHKIRANNDKTVAEVDLRKKLGQFLYLQNLSKVRRIN